MVLRLLLLYTMFAFAQGNVHYYDFVLKEANFTRLCSSKSMLVVNEQYPGPVIRVTKGDIVYVNVHNQGDYGVTIHWHGVHQPRNPWSDGPEYITQCPIEPASNFTYEVIFSDEEGTLWWHAHSDWTRASVHGAIVALPNNETGYPFPQPDGEEIIGGRYRTGQCTGTGTLLFCTGKNTGRTGCIPAIPANFGKYRPIPGVPAAVNPKRYTGIDRYPKYIVPVAKPVQSPVRCVNNYTYSSTPIFPSSLPTYEDFDPAINFTYRFRSLASQNHPVNIPKNITTRMYLTVSVNNVIFDYEGTSKTNLAASFNNVSWINPSTDVLLAYYRNMSGFYTTDFPNYPPSFFDFIADDVSDDKTLTVQGTKVKVLNYNEEVEIVLQDTNVFDGSEDHPVHLHGYNFYVVGSGYGNFDNETDPKGYNLVDPPKMNTVSVPKDGWVALRFKASNPGVWFFHCHFERHISWGMVTVFIVKNGGTLETSIRDPPPYLPPCKSSSW
ncbi:hypothetical protein ACJW31_01G249700 [Castanea mollissima]